MPLWKQKYMHTHTHIFKHISTQLLPARLPQCQAEKISRTPTDRERMTQSMLSELLLFLPKFSILFPESHPGSVPCRQRTPSLTPQLFALTWSLSCPHPRFVPTLTLALFHCSLLVSLGLLPTFWISHPFSIPKSIFLLHRF